MKPVYIRLPAKMIGAPVNAQLASHGCSGPAACGGRAGTTATAGNASALAEGERHPNMPGTHGAHGAQNPEDAAARASGTTGQRPRHHG